MSASTESVPSYRRHKQSNQAVVTLPDGLGRRRDVLLGKYGTKSSRIEYARVIAEWESAGRRLVIPSMSADGTVHELTIRFWEHAKKHYRHADGRPTSELCLYKIALRPLKQLYGDTPAAEFSPLKLKAVRQELVKAKLCRNVVNKYIGKIKHVFRWAAAEEFVPVTVPQALSCVSGLTRGRTEARETDPVKPVPSAFIDAIRAHVLPEVWAMIELQLLTGMRPSEVCGMRACDIDMGGVQWIYRPPQHKTAWRGRERSIVLGPRAQQIVRAQLTTDLQANLFSPRRAMESRYLRIRAARKGKVQPSQVCRKKRRPLSTPGDSYSRFSYSAAVAAGCKKVDSKLRKEAIKAASLAGVKPPDEDVKFFPTWRPNRLRHNFASSVRKQFGLEAAQVALGHARADVTQVYAEANTALASQVAAAIG